MRIAMVGLGRMGLGMTKRLLLRGIKVTVYNRSKDKAEEAIELGAGWADSLRELVELLSPPRVVWLMIPAGRPVDETIETLREYLSEGDVIIDGGNTFYKDDLRREEELKRYGIRYMDIGVSGGIWGLKTGYCLMIGGPRDVYESLVPVFKALAPQDGYLYCGPTGAGHFLKMVHNGIEYAIMEAYAEGFDLIQASPYGKELDLASVARLWNHGSVIRSWLLELLETALLKDERLSTIKGYVEDSGEGRWTVQEAIERGVSIPAISLSLMRRFRSREQDSFAEKVLAALRKEFGGHSVIKTG